MEPIKDQSFGVIPVFKKPNGSFLFCVVQDKRGNHYGFPKGHENAGESQEMTARRELEEETGILDANIMHDAVFDQTYQFEHEGMIYNKTVRYFLGFALSTNTVVPEESKTEISDMKWLSYERARKVITHEDTRVILDEVWEYLNNNFSALINT